jgi:hypothetical protein
MIHAFLVGSKVRFTQERLSILTPRDRAGLEGRIGVVQAHGHQARKPTVQFPADGARVELRLFAVDQKHLELVEGPPEAVATPVQTPAPASAADTMDNLFDSAMAAGESDATAEAPGPAADDGGGKLSQAEMDNLFD